MVAYSDFIDEQGTEFSLISGPQVPDGPLSPDDLVPAPYVPKRPFGISRQLEHGLETPERTVLTSALSPLALQPWGISLYISEPLFLLLKNTGKQCLSHCGLVQIK